MRKLRLVALFCLALTPLLGGAVPMNCSSLNWDDWTNFKAVFEDSGGRIVDPSDPNELYTTSEGQSYAMFFALVAGDQSTFNQLVSWTDKNMTNGHFGQALPGWKWGHRSDGTWGLFDTNSASDADLWMTYSLLEAGRLWHNDEWTKLGQQLGKTVLDKETVITPVGRILLPGRVGFQLGSNQWRLNPSYWPMQILHYLKDNGADPRWSELLKGTRNINQAISVWSGAPDWFIYDVKKGVQRDTQGLSLGSYNAIRVYLWSGMLDKHSSDYSFYWKQFRPIYVRVASISSIPEEIDVASGGFSENGPFGFLAAFYPGLLNIEPTSQSDQQYTAIKDQMKQSHSYYSQVLSLFSMGWAEHRFLFNQQGMLKLPGNCS
jgi:endoglucanase